MRSVFSSQPIPSANRRTQRGLRMATARPKAQSWLKACFSYPPVASMATSSTPCWRQNSARPAIPSGVLGKQHSGPSQPMRACKSTEQTSTPQMILDTVTCLVRAIEKSGDCSVVRASGGGPKAHPRLLNQRDHGRRQPRGGFDASDPSQRHSTTTCRHITDTRDLYPLRNCFPSASRSNRDPSPGLKLGFGISEREANC